jgi:hypothetical protein
MKKYEIDALINEQQTIILDRESKLTSTDYIAAKIAEGKATKSEYADKIAERQQWRDDINAAKDEIERLKAIEPEPDEPEPIDEQE